MSDLFADHGVHAVVDGQFGSTGKGVIAAWLARQAWREDKLFHAVVSNAGPNSGHTFYDSAGVKHVLKQLPTFAVASHVDHYQYVPVQLSAGAIIDPEILVAEAIKYSGIPIYVDPMAAVITQAEKEAEHSGSVAAVAGTRSGTGAALARKVLREPTAVFRHHFTENPDYYPDNVHLGALPINKMGRKRIFLEVSQGFSLGLNSDFYPKVTSRECTVMQGMADARIPPHMAAKTYVSMRSFPIRVGNVDGFSSGGWYDDQKEISWEELGQKPELTTVTQRVRRIATFSERQAEEAIAANGADFVFLNFMNYMNDAEQREVLEKFERIANSLHHFDMIYGFGPTSEDVRW